MKRKTILSAPVNVPVYDTMPEGWKINDGATTREIIKLLKESGNHVQILTKGDGRRDFDLLDENDWYGITYSGAYRLSEPGTPQAEIRVLALVEAHTRGIKTWVSYEPVLNSFDVLSNISHIAPYVDRVKIGKLNYYKSIIDWADFGRRAEELCKELGLDYYIKDSLRKEMNNGDCEVTNDV